MNCGLKIRSAESAGKYWICLPGTGIISVNTGGITMSEEYPVCLSCNSENVAWIFWGYPGDMHAIEQDLKDGKIVLGGCIVTEHDSKWECTDCHHRWGNRDDS